MTTHETRPKRVALLMAGGSLGWAVANTFIDRFPDLLIIQEDPEPKATIYRRRMRLLGPLQAAGQFAFGAFSRVLGRLARDRLRDIRKQHRFRIEPNPNANLVRVSSVNSEACRNALKEARPDVVAVYGTRIIRKETLQCVPAPFINYHAGINPKYRGQNPAYWALRSGDPEHAGITIHLVDEGVDTGSIIHQQKVDFSSKDSIVTYQHYQAGVALHPFMKAIEDALVGRLQTQRVDLPSQQFFDPTLWGYLWTGLTRHVW